MSFFNLVASSDLSLPADSYIYQILPLQPKVGPWQYAPLAQGSLLAALSSDGTVTAVDAATLKPVTSIKNVNKSVTCMKRYAAAGEACTTIVTTGRDGNVNGWDLRSGKREWHAEATLERTGKQCLSALETNANAHFLAAGTELYEREGPGDAPIFVWDARKLPEPTHKYTESHTDTITELRMQPTSPHVLLSASTDGLISLIDMREMDEDEAVLQVFNHKSAVHHAGFIGGDVVYGLGTDETLSFYALEAGGDEPTEKPPTVFGDVREALGMEYIVDLYPGADGSSPYLVGGKHSAQELDFVPLSNQNGSWTPNVSRRLRLEGAHGEELVRDVYEDDANVFTCGEDGMLKAWRRIGSEGGSEASSSAKKGKRAQAGKDDKGRFKPY